MGFVYILKCRDGKFYTGSTRDITHRFAQHSDGQVAFTRRRLPVQLAWTQEFESIQEAYVVEHQIKGWSRAKKIALIAGRIKDLPALASKGRTRDAHLSLEAQRRIALATQAMNQSGALPDPAARLATTPTDAMVRQGRRSWRPRAARQNWD